MRYLHVLVPKADRRKGLVPTPYHRPTLPLDHGRVPERHASFCSTILLYKTEISHLLLAEEACILLPKKSRSSLKVQNV